MTYLQKLRWKLFHKSRGHKITLKGGKLPLCSCGITVGTIPFEGWD